jgi:hypothetical protein
MTMNMLIACGPGWVLHVQRHRILGGVALNASTIAARNDVGVETLNYCRANLAYALTTGCSLRCRFNQACTLAIGGFRNAPLLWRTFGGS